MKSPLKPRKRKKLSKKFLSFCPYRFKLSHFKKNTIIKTQNVQIKISSKDFKIALKNFNLKLITLKLKTTTLKKKKAK